MGYSYFIEVRGELQFRDFIEVSYKEYLRNRNDETYISHLSAAKKLG